MPKPTPTELALFDNSIERVINTTLRILETIEPKCHGNLGEDVSTNLQDWRDLKSVVTEIWDAARNAAFIKANPQ